MTCKGVVKGNIVVLDEGVTLPDGATVVVTIEPPQQAQEEIDTRRALTARMRAFGQKLEGRNVNLGALILEGREELRQRA